MESTVKKGTPAASSPRCNNKRASRPLRALDRKSGPIPGSPAATRPGLPHLVHVSVGAAADPLDELVVLLRVPPQDVRGRPRRGLHLRSGPGPRRLCPAAPRFPLTRASGAASQHGASSRSSACTRDKPRRVSSVAGDDPASGPRGPAPFLPSRRRP